METGLRKFSKRRLSLTFTKNRAAVVENDTRSERGAIFYNTNTESDSDSEFNSDGEFIGM